MKCSLCGENRILVRSHFLPRSVYRICGNDAASPSPPVLVYRAKAVLLPAQAKKPLLCSECDERLSRNGETYVVGQCMRGTNTFKLRERIEEKVRSEPSRAADGFLLRELDERYAEHYIYFAISIFWRAAVTDWRLGDSEMARISLGPSLKERFRLWLHGDGAFPKGVALALSVFQERDVPTTIFFPFRDQAHPFAMYRFVIPGLQFCLWIEQAVTDEVVGISNVLPGDAPVFLEAFWTSGLADAAKRAAKTSYRKGKLKGLMDEDGRAPRRD